jgi:hypothetical protein
MARSKCQPCVTVSTIWKLGKIHFKHFMQDIKAFNEVKEYSCKIHYSEDISKTPLIPKGEVDVIRTIRETAATNYKSSSDKISEELDNQI